ncbi:MAG: hypothetical protein DWQ19_12330 [Crenarchaeota archaeon]|nr:MAG: hypothetical protein DWQ19_12330 [Thermoproteota archaeon]
MKRKLISYEVFENMQSNSLSTAENELLEAKDILARALDVENLNLVCYGPEDALFESNDGTYVHTNYTLNENTLDFDHITNLVIDEETEQDHSKKVLADMLDAILDGKEEKANELFDNFVATPNFKRNLHESVQTKVKKSKKATKAKAPKRFNTALKFKTKNEKAKKLTEWKSLVENVNKFVQYKQYGNILNENTVNFDEKGNVNGVSVPTTHARNEAKMLSFNWKTLDSDVKVLRNGAKHLAENAEFCKSVAYLKRQNALSDNDSLQEALEDVVSRWPSVLYLTQEELATVVGESLSAVGASNYDDQTCTFMAEAILRTAHDSYVDRVSKILTLAGATVEEDVEDAYEAFQGVVDNFFPSLDESSALEMQAYIDLYDALRSAYNISESDTLKSETSTHLHELAAIIEQEVEPSLEVAVAAAEWLSHLVETNLETSGWNVSNNVHITVSGDHPAMGQKAKQGYSPANDGSGDWGDVAPASDGKSYKGGEADAMRGSSWGNIGGGDVYPSLQNPYTPKPFGDYKMKGETHIDNESNPLGHSGGSDAWPALQNPYQPHAETPGSYKMNHGKEADLVVDK